jgi:hypothetical protein
MMHTFARAVFGLMGPRQTRLRGCGFTLMLGTRQSPMRGIPWAICTWRIPKVVGSLRQDLPSAMRLHVATSRNFEAP